jgi:protein gp37
MGEKTTIGWTHHTFSAWIGCHKVSPACKHCYAEAFAKRTGKDVWGADKPRYFVGDDTWKKPLKWNRDAEKAGERRRVFCGSMMDVLEWHESEVTGAKMADARARLWDLIEATPWLDWLLLTKRPENAPSVLPDRWWFAQLPPNVWMGTTVENQEYADLRIPHLLKVKARVLFLSCEPLLGPIDLRVLRTGDFDSLDALTGVRSYAGRGTGVGHEVQEYRAGVNWVIAGGESGHHHREHRLEWSRSLRDQAKAAGAAFFFKQLGEGATEYRGRNPMLTPAEGVEGPDFSNRRKLPLARGSKGESLDEIPADLRVREFPGAA